MARILEITPTGRTAYDMPDEIRDVVCYALNCGARSVRRVLAVFPPEWRDQVTVTPLPVPERRLGAAGWSGDLIIEDVFPFPADAWETIRPTIEEVAR